jgi:hypothetical protein
VIGIPVIAGVTYLIAFFTVPPSFSASAHKQPNGDYRIEVDPNFVVFSVYNVTVSDSAGVLAERDEPKEGPQHIIVPGPIPSGTNVSVTCMLVYDRPMPSGTTRTVNVVLP